MGRLTRQRSDKMWEYTLADAVRDEEGFDSMETCIQQRNNTVTEYIATRPNLELWKAAEMKWGARVGIRW